MDTDERRGGVRHAKTISIHYTGRDGVTGYGYAETQDVSAGGLKFFCDHFLRKGLRLELGIDAGSTRIIVRDARVAWAVKAPHADRYYIGLEFDQLSPTEYRQLVECRDAL